MLSLTASNKQVSVSNNDLSGFLQSTAMFLLSYQFCWLFSQFATIVTARLYGIKGALFFNEIRFSINQYSLLWNEHNIIAITFAGSLSSLLVFAVANKILRSRVKTGILLRTFLLWTYLHSMVLSFGALLSGILTGEGIGIGLNWLYMNEVIKLLLILVAIVVMVILSINMVQFLPKTGSFKSWMRERHSYIVNRLIFPSMLVSIFLCLLQYTSLPFQNPDIFYCNLLNISIPFLLTTLALKKRIFPYPMGKIITAEKKYTTIALIMAAIILTVGLRISLSFGVAF